MNLKNIPIQDIVQELKSRGLGVYPLELRFTSNLKYPIIKTKCTQENQSNNHIKAI
jgi:hypothetical protein